MLLIELLETFADLQFGYDERAVEAALRGGRIDDDDAMALRSSAQFLGGLIVDRSIASFHRPIQGGEAAPMPLAHWELDDFVPRFAASAYDPTNWHNRDASPTHWIFVSESDVEGFLDSWVAGDFNPRELADAPPPSAAANKPAEEIIRLKEVMRMTGLARSTVYERMAAGTFPGKVKLGERATGWYLHEVQSWNARRPRT